MGKLHAKTKEFLDYFQKLRISDQCKGIRTDLTMLVTDKNMFSEILTEQLKPEANGVPYHLDLDDPEQIAIIKKLSNILYNVEIIAGELEQIELTDEMYTVELAQHAPQIFKNTCKAINQIYDAIQLVNNSNVSIQTIMPPQFQMLQEGCTYLCQKLSQFTNSRTWEGVEQTLEDSIGDTLQRMPTERRPSQAIDFSYISKALMDTPGYISQLQNVIKSESLFPEVQAFESPEDYKRRIEKQAQSLSFDLKKVTLETGLEQTLNLVSAAQELNNFSVDLINVGSAATKEAYYKSVEKLNYFKHELMPQIITELESIEENLGRRSGIYTNPVLETAQDCYQQLVSFVNSIPPMEEYMDYYREFGNQWYSKILKDGKKVIFAAEDSAIDPNLNIFMDPGFIEKRRALQTKRLIEAQT